MSVPTGDSKEHSTTVQPEPGAVGAMSSAPKEQSTAVHTLVKKTVALGAPPTENPVTSSPVPGNTNPQDNIATQGNSQPMEVNMVKPSSEMCPPQPPGPCVVTSQKTVVEVPTPHDHLPVQGTICIEMPTTLVSDVTKVTDSVVPQGDTRPMQSDVSKSSKGMCLPQTTE